MEEVEGHRVQHRPRPPRPSAAHPRIRELIIGSEGIDGMAKASLEKVFKGKWG